MLCDLGESERISALGQHTAQGELVHVSFMAIGTRQKEQHRWCLEILRVVSVDSPSCIKLWVRDIGSDKGVVRAALWMSVSTSNGALTGLNC